MGGDLTIVLPMVCIFLRPILADYPCVCNYNVEKAIFSSKSDQGQPIGYVYEFDCKSQLGKEDGDWLAIAFEHQEGYIQKDGQIMSQVCPGSPPDEDVVTTTPAPLTTTLLVTSTTTEPTSQALSTDSTVVTNKASTKTRNPLTTSVTRSVTSPPSTTASTTTTTSSFPPSTTTLQTTTMPSTLTTTTEPSTTVKSSTSSTEATTIAFTKSTETTTVVSTSTESTTLASTSSTKSTTVSSTSSTESTTVTSTSSTEPTSSRHTTIPSTSSSTTNAQQTKTTSRTTTIRPTTTTTLQPVQTTKGTVVSCHDLLAETVTKDNGTLFAYGQKCFELLRIHTTWVNAELECRRKGGHLIDIVDSNEQRVIFQVINTYYHEAVWIGLHDMHHEERFEWTSGEPVAYTNWYPGRKDPALHWTEDCVAMALNKYSGRWEDRSCTETRGFICQFALMVEEDHECPSVNVLITSGHLGRTNIYFNGDNFHVTSSLHQLVYHDVQAIRHVSNSTIEPLQSNSAPLNILCPEKHKVSLPALIG